MSKIDSGGAGAEGADVEVAGAEGAGVEVAGVEGAGVEVVAAERRVFRSEGIWCAGADMLLGAANCGAA